MTEMEKELVETLTRLDANMKTLMQEVSELKQALRDMERRTRNTEKKVFFLWVLATGGLGVLFSILAQKLKTLGGQA